MALQDNFIAIYNKKEQAKQQKEEEKQSNLIFEIELQELLQDYITEYLTTHKMLDILLSSTKKRIIKRILRENTFTVEKYSKYKNINAIETFLLIKYDKIANKCLRIAKLYDKDREKNEIIEIKTQQEAELQQATEEARQELKKQQNKEKWQNIGFILLLILLAPIALIWGILSGLSKKRPKKEVKKWILNRLMIK